MYSLDNYWNSAENRRKFFLQFSKQKGFDPLIAENWDKITKKDIINQVRN